MSLIPLDEMRQEQEDAEAAMIAADLDRDIAPMPERLVERWSAREMLDDLMKRVEDFTNS